jgi:hypothetical protein
VDFWTRWTGIILVALALTRAAVLVAHDPLAGYADSGAMRATAACVALAPKDDPGSHARERPVTAYATGASTRDCYWSAEAAFAGLSLAVARATGADTRRFQVRWLGAAKLLLLFSMAFVVAFALRDHAAASAVHGLVALLVLADPAVTLWMNTFHREFFAMWAAYMVVGGACVLALTQRMVLPWAMLMAGVAVLALSREYDALLGVLLVAIAWPWMWHRSQRLAAATVLIALAAWVAAFVALQHEGVPRGPSGDFAAILHSAIKALAGFQQAAPAALGALDGTVFTPARDLPAWGFSLLEAATRALPPPAFGALQLTLLLLLPASLLTLAALRPRRGDPFTPLMLGMMLGAITWHALAAALYGGAPDPAVRYLPAILAMFVAVIGALVGLPVLARRWIAEWRDMPLELGVGAAMVGAGAYAVVLVT